MTRVECDECGQYVCECPMAKPRPASPAGVECEHVFTKTGLRVHCARCDEDAHLVVGSLRAQLAAAQAKAKEWQRVAEEDNAEIHNAGYECRAALRVAQGRERGLRKAAINARIELRRNEFTKAYDILAEVTEPASADAPAASETPTLLSGHDAPCHLCGKPCDAMAGNPGMWPIGLCIDESAPGVTRWCHQDCVLKHLHAPAARPGADIPAALLVRCGCCERDLRSHQMDGLYGCCHDCASCSSLGHEPCCHGSCAKAAAGKGEP